MVSNITAIDAMPVAAPIDELLPQTRSIAWLSNSKFMSPTMTSAPMRL